jgi:hypothetical protein
MADLLTILIPFLFVLAVVYGALEVSDIFKRSQVKLIISLCFALVAMTTGFITEFIMGILPYAIMAFIAIFFVGFALSFFKGKGGEKGERDYTLMAIVLILLLLFLANYGIGFLEDYMPGISAEEFATGVGIVVIFLVLYSAYMIGKKQPG